MSYIVGMDLTTNDPTPQFKLGAIGQDYQGYLYKYVQYNQGAGAIAAVAGNITGYYAPSGVSAGSTTVVTSDVSDTAGAMAGMLMAVLTTAYYGWIQIKGRATITPAFVSGADGNALTLSSTTDGTVKVAGAVTDAGGAVSIDATAKILNLDCPF